jgi:hypothetical protein
VPVLFTSVVLQGRAPRISAPEGEAITRKEVWKAEGRGKASLPLCKS